MSNKAIHPRFLRRSDIDSAWWDAHISASALPLPYALSWYLDILSPNWMACVSPDERWVMPLPVNRKIGGFLQVYQPFLTQQLGVFGDQMPETGLVNALVFAIHRRFIRVNLHLNEANPLPNLSGAVCTPRTNMLLPLQRPYTEIRDGYNRNLLRNLRKTEGNLEYLDPPFTADQLVTFFRTHLTEKIGSLPFPWAAITAMIRSAIERKEGFVRGVTDRQGQWLAMGFFLSSGERIINLLGASTPDGIRYLATHFLLDRVFNEWHNTARVFDFEGSSIPGVAEFFRGFGATTTSFPVVKGGWVGQLFGEKNSALHR